MEARPRHLDRDDEDNIEDVVSVVETKVCLVVLRTKSCGNLSSNDDVDPGTGGVEEAHHHGETEAGHGGVACKSLLANENAF